MRTHFVALLVTLLALFADGRTVRRVAPRSSAGSVARRAVPAARRRDDATAPPLDRNRLILEAMRLDDMGCLPPREPLLADSSSTREKNSDAAQKRAARREVVEMYTSWMW